MVVSAGTRLGPYEVVSRIGAGGMGEVWKARDTRLDRSVAVKILPAEVAENAQLKIRFEREAKTISQLNHPNICTLFDVGDDYLVMELLEGESLAERLTKGALPLQETLKYGAQIAEALDKAHRAGVVHRDVKPANVMLTKSGAKLLDFGLAKSDTAIIDVDGATVQKQLTQEGTILGTFQYMAPEQIEGQEADARTDIFAFGALLYEMATGVRAFEGKTKTSLIAAIVKEQPRPVSQLIPLAPPALDHIVAKCLQKDPDDRWQSAHDIADELRWITEAGSQAHTATPAARKRPRWLFAATTTLAAVAVAATATWGWWRATRRGPEIVRLSIPLPARSTLSGEGMPQLAFSHDGQQIAFSAGSEKPQLYLRRLDRFEVAPLPGTERGEGPFFSPDGEWLGFFVPGEMKKLRLSGGVPLHVAPAGNGRGGWWGADGYIYYTPTTSSGLSRIAADGATPETLTTPSRERGENSHRWPQLLPDGKHVLFTIRTDRIESFDEAKIAVLSLDTKQWRVVVEGGSHARYLDSGHLVFSQRGDLFAVPFDLRSLTTVGSPRPVVDGVMRSESSGAAQYSIAESSGTLAFIAGSNDRKGTTMLEVDRAGKELRSFRLPRWTGAFCVSPDQQRLAVQVSAANDDIWTYELARGTLSRVTSEPGDEWGPTWSADGSSIVFGSDQKLSIQKANGSGAAKVLTKQPINAASSASADGRFIAYSSGGPSTGLDLWLFSLADGKATPLLQTVNAESGPNFSPDGRWLAYVSNSSGTREVYLRHLDEESEWQVSTGGGYGARWARDGRQIFYRQADGFYAVPVTLGPKPVIGTPRLLFTHPGVEWHDVFGDGFLFSKVEENVESATSINVVLNWRDELKARMP